MISYFLKRPIAISMFYLSIVILGVISYKNLSVEGQPDTELPQIVVETSWPNTSPEVVQIFLTSPIEEAAAQIEGVEEMLSRSRRGRSQVTLKFNRETDMEFARLDLNERISKLRAELPPGSSQPILSMTEKDETANKNFMTFNISGPYSLERLSEVFDDYLRDEITAAEGVADVVIFGEREKSIKVRLDRAKMDLYKIVPAVVTSKIRQLTQTYETPRTTFKNQEYTITIANSIAELDEVGSMVVANDGESLIRLRDVGVVELGQAKVFSYSRLNGNPTLRVDIEREVGASVIQTAARVRQKVDSVLPSMPMGFRLDWNKDEGEMMQEQLSSIYERGLWCIAIIVILLLFFLQSFSAAMVITLNIMFSVLITINFMYYFGVTFNVVSLSGLAIGFGMLVDNAIVVLENIFRYRELGKSRMESAILGVKEIVWAIFAATLTTVSAFMCMLFLKDRLAVTYLPLALAVIFSLSASLLVSFTFTPLLSVLIRGSNLTKKARSESKQPKSDNSGLGFILRPIRAAFAYLAGGLSNSLGKMTSFYGSVVMWTLRHKTLVVAITATIFFLFLQIFRTEIDSGGWSFWGNADDRVMVYVRMPEGAELETADEVIRQFEEPLLAVEGYKDMSVRVYDTFAILDVSFESETLSSAYPLALKSKLIGIAQGFAGVGISVMGINSDDNYYSGSTGWESYNSSIRILGYNYKQLMDYGEKILQGVKRQRRVKTTKLDTGSGWRSRDQTETTLEINREALRQYDIDVAYLMTFISTNLQVESQTVTKFQGEEMKLEVKFEDADDFDIKALENLVITTEELQRIRLADLVSIEERKVSGTIDRKDQQYAINVRWDYKGSPKRARKYNEAVFNSLALPAGYTAEMDYSRFTSEEENENLRFVIILAVLIVFMIIAALYESFIDPLVIFITIPLSFIGVSWIYWFTGNSFDSTATIGLIILAGIVVNNSILLVSHINHEVYGMTESGLTFQQAIAKACKDRFRPILLTAITTIVGLLPLLDEFVVFFLSNPVSGFFLGLLGFQLEGINLENIGLRQTMDMFSSLSRSTVGGMLSATFSTLFIIPVVYSIFFRLKQWIHFRISEISNLAKTA